MKILVADDEPISRALISAALDPRHFEAVFVSDGEAAWEVLQGSEAPQLVILDWMMPRVSGVELCERIRAMPVARYTYILLITSKNDGADLVAGLKAGADDYVTKPFSRRELEARLTVGRRILDLEERLVKAHDEVAFLASHDALTGALSRRAALGQFRAEIQRTRRAGSCLGVCLIDLDHFKQVNDTFGHLVGDTVLAEAVRRWTLQLRAFDMLSRYGGEEFMVVLPECNAVLTVAERLRQALGRQPIQVNGVGELCLTCSIGTTAFGGSGEATPDSLIAEADKALYRAKSLGRDRVESYAPDPDSTPAATAPGADARSAT